MNTVVKNSHSELVDCAVALLKLDLTASVELMKFWISEGYWHLASLRAKPNCSEAQVYSLAQRISRVELLLETKQKQEGV